MIWRTREHGTPRQLSVAGRKNDMSAYGDPSSGPRRAAQTYADEQPPLAFEAEFDGARRPQAPAEQDPCDPDRYWQIFSSGTD
jgi:hypothetical protein